MWYLAVVSLIWAFSFGLIKSRLADLDPSLVGAIRLLLAFLVFLPFLRVRRVPKGLARELLAIGAVQFGVMYLCYLAAFQFLKAHEVALCTIFTPFFVTLLQDWHDRRLRTVSLFAVTLAVIGTGVVGYHGVAGDGLLAGFLLVQASNFCFAFGQIRYRLAMAKAPGLKDREGFAYLYLGATVVTAAAAACTAVRHPVLPTAQQLAILLYLGVLASGVCFFLWNLGARRTQAGTLAIFNNAKIPLGVACALLFFGEHADLTRLLAGGGLMLVAVVVNERSVRAVRAGL